MNLKQRAELYRELDAKRTQGEWKVIKCGHNSSVDCGDTTICDDESYYPAQVIQENQDFVARSPNIVADLFDVLELVEVMREALEKNMDSISIGVQMAGNGTFSQQRVACDSMIDAKNALTAYKQLMGE